MMTHGAHLNELRMAAVKKNAPTKNKPKCANLSAWLKSIPFRLLPGIDDNTVMPTHHTPNITHHMASSHQTHLAAATHLLEVICVDFAALKCKLRKKIP